jgi:two-component system sensor histidine kinase MprB
MHDTDEATIQTAAGTEGDAWPPRPGAPTPTPGAASVAGDTSDGPRRPSLNERWRRVSAAVVAGLSLRTRFTLLVAAAVGLAVALTSAAAYFSVSNLFYSQLDNSLFQRAIAAQQARLDVSQLPGPLFAANGVRAEVLFANGAEAKPSRQSALPPIGDPELAVATGTNDRSLRTAVASDGRDYRLIAVPNGPGQAFVLAQPLDDIERSLAQLRTVLIIVGLIGIGVAASAGLTIANAGLRPVKRLTAAAEHVARTEELTPIEVEGEDEIGRMARSFNAMLASLSQSRDRQQRLVADASHELRTPLTSLRTNLDLLAQSFRGGSGGTGMSPADRDELLGDVRGQVEELSMLVGDLVELAREDAPEVSAVGIDLAEICERALDRVRRRAPSLRFAVELEPWLLDGDPTALERAVTNLLDNAVKWSPPRGTVSLRLHAGEVVVTDEGPGIAESDLVKVFDRFYRSPEARTMPGSGLGLSIVRQAARRHNGWVRASRAEGGGARLSMWLPGAAPPGPENGGPASVSPGQTRDGEPPASSPVLT